MRKSIYSLVLPEELMAFVDVQAQAKNRSRSQFIEEILAKHLSLPTPQTSVNRLLEEIYENLGQQGRLEMLARNKGNAIQMRAPLNYKYSPKVKYILDVKSRRDGFDGLLKVMPRTQSEAFMSLLVKFFDDINDYEHNCFKGRTREDLHDQHLPWEPLGRHGYSFDGSRFMKPILMGNMKAPGDEAAAQHLSAYIQCLHEAIDCYFGLYEEAAKQQMDMTLWNDHVKATLKTCYHKYGIA